VGFLGSSNNILTFPLLPKRDEAMGGWRKLHNNEFRNLYSSPSIIRIIKSRWLRWAGYVASMRKIETHKGSSWISQRERGH
jgi:hypothetical protein